MTKRIFYNYFWLFALLLVFALAAVARAQNLSNISYPIAELGNCDSKAECKAFCDEPVNYVACAQWAAKNGIMPEEKVSEVEKEVEQIEKFESGEISEGPGGCKTPAECDAYCQQPEHGEECFKFGLEHNLISPEEAKKIQEQVEEMKGPGGCKTREECDTYCADPKNAEECIKYGVKDGTLTQEEADELLRILAQERKMRELKAPPPGQANFEPKGPKVDEEKIAEMLKSQKGPGGCSTVQECKQYCEDIRHAEECLSFVEENNLVSPEDLKQMKAMTEVMMSTGGPGGCKSHKECDQYCSLPEHQDECLKFAEEHGLVSPEEAKMMEKIGGGGPGGCRNQQECDAYCRNPEHMEECLMFSVKQGLMTEEDAKKMMEIMKEQEKRGLEIRGKSPKEGMGPKMPHMFEGGMPKQNEWPEPRQGFEGGIPPEGARQGFPQGQMPSEGRMPPSGQMPPQGMMPESGQMTGPGGCRTKEECDAYCSKPEHMEECSKFSPQGGSREEMPPEGQMPPEGKMFPNGQMPPQGEMMPPEGQMMPPSGETAPSGSIGSSLLEALPQPFSNLVNKFLINLVEFLKF